MSRVLSNAVNAAIFTLALFVGGCASQQADATYRSAQNAEPPGRRIPLEADGLPVQLAPRNQQPGEDDPTQPWSPNYGSEPPAKEVEPSRAPSRQTGPTRLAIVDPEAVIRRAVADHEMQRQ